MKNKELIEKFRQELEALKVEEKTIQDLLWFKANFSPSYDKKNIKTFKFKVTDIDNYIPPSTGYTSIYGGGTTTINFPNPPCSSSIQCPAGCSCSYGQCVPATGYKSGGILSNSKNNSNGNAGYNGNNSFSKQTLLQQKQKLLQAQQQQISNAMGAWVPNGPIGSIGAMGTSGSASPLTSYQFVTLDLGATDNINSLGSSFRSLLKIIDGLLGCEDTTPEMKSLINKLVSPNYYMSSGYFYTSSISTMLRELYSTITEETNPNDFRAVLKYVMKVFNTDRYDTSYGILLDKLYDNCKKAIEIVKTLKLTLNENIVVENYISIDVLRGFSSQNVQKFIEDKELIVNFQNSTDNDYYNSKLLALFSKEKLQFEESKNLVKLFLSEDKECIEMARELIRSSVVD